jgi:acetyl esterase/lipase
MGFLFEEELHYSPQLILLGNSAGAHLSMLYAYHFDADEKRKGSYQYCRSCRPFR